MYNKKIRVLLVLFSLTLQAAEPEFAARVPTTQAPAACMPEEETFIVSRKNKKSVSQKSIVRLRQEVAERLGEVARASARVIGELAYIQEALVTEDDIDACDCARMEKWGELQSVQLADLEHFIDTGKIGKKCASEKCASENCSSENCAGAEVYDFTKARSACLMVGAQIIQKYARIQDKIFKRITEIIDSDSKSCFFKATHNEFQQYVHTLQKYENMLQQALSFLEDFSASV